MKNKVLFILLIFAAIFQACNQIDKNNNQGNEQNIFHEIDTELGDMRDQIINLQNEVTNKENINIEDALEALKILEKKVVLLHNIIEENSNSEMQNDITTNSQKFQNLVRKRNTDALFNKLSKLLILLIIIFVIILICYLIIRQYINRNKPASTKKDTTNSRNGGDNYLNTEQFEHPTSITKSTEIVKSNLPSFSSLSTNDDIFPGTSAFDEDDISLLYNSSEKRNKRYNSDTDDIFLDISSSVSERLAMGDKVNLILEKRGSPSTAMFVLVADSDLYMNFYNYNETNSLIKDKENILSMIYIMREEYLPGYVKKCIPATVKQSADCYMIKNKGNLEIRH